MKKTKANSNKGITLIALVITIIVLLILAAVSIATLTGENGILTKANDASETTKDKTEEEQVKVAVNGALTDGTGTLSTENIKKALKKEFGTDKVTGTTFTGEGPWTFKGERKTYTIEKNGNITSGGTTTPPKEEKLAKEVLQINPDGKEDYEKSPYVKYGEDTFRVLYSDEKHGVQLIPLNTDIKVDLGFDCSLVEPFDFGYDGANENTKKGAASYQNAKQILRDVARTCLEGKEVFKDARCLGSEPKIINGMFNESDTVETVDDINSCSGVFKKGDMSYEADVEALKMTQIQPAGDLWLASRIVNRISSKDCTFYVARYSGGEIYTDSAELLTYYGLWSIPWKSRESCLNKLMPIFLLDDGTRIAGRRRESRK